MTLGDDVDLEEYILAKDDLSGADIKAVCTEAGLLALRERRMRVTKAVSLRIATSFSFWLTDISTPELYRTSEQQETVCSTGSRRTRYVLLYVALWRYWR